MRTFSYLVEIILVIVLIITYLYYTQLPVSLTEYFNSFKKQYMLYTGSSTLYNRDVVSYLQANQYDIVAYTVYSLFSSYISGYNLKMDIYYPINIYNLGNYTCYEFLFPFPSLGFQIPYTVNITPKSENFFMIRNSNGYICANFSASNDWRMLIINNYNASYNPVNLSIKLNITDMYNVTVDPFSFFAYNVDYYPLQIVYLNVTNDYDGQNFYPIINISVNLPQNYVGPIIILFRGNKELYNYLNNLNSYILVNNLTGELVGYQFSPFSWETLYVSSQCFDKSNVISFTSKNQFFNLTNSSYYPSQLSGNTPITVVAWIYIKDYYYSSCTVGENYISGLFHTSDVKDYCASTFRQVIIPNNSQYYLGIDISCSVGYLSNYTLPLNQWIFVFWEYDNVNGQFYGGFINQTGLYYGQLIDYPGWIGHPGWQPLNRYPLNLYSTPNATIYLGTPTSLYPPNCTFLGNIYVVAFYNQFLSIDQIKNIYYTGNFEQYNPVVVYYGSNYDPSVGILYTNNPNLNLKAYNNPQLISTIKPYSQLSIEYSIPPNYEVNFISSNLNLSNCYPVPTYYSYKLIPVISYPFWKYFGVYPIVRNYKYYSTVVLPYGLGFSKLTTYGS
ncbi:MAG: hypothetical protein ACP5G1_03325 [Nanopusillaceae archaeon]